MSSVSWHSSHFAVQIHFAHLLPGTFHCCNFSLPAIYLYWRFLLLMGKLYWQSSIRFHHISSKASTRRHCSWQPLVSWYFEPSQPQRITSQPKTTFTLSPIYSACKSSNHKLSKTIISVLTQQTHIKNLPQKKKKKQQQQTHTHTHKKKHTYTQE